ncbi:MAG: lipase/acyltransferase domain-containing protein [Thermoanaerobaculia bacterium]
MTRKPVVFIPGYPASELIQRSKRRTVFPPSVGDLLDPRKHQEIVDLLVGPDDPPGDIVAGEPIRDVLGIAKQAQSLYDLLRSNRYGYTIEGGDNFRPVGWDWRQAVDERGLLDRILRTISELQQKNGGAKVVVIAHSTGCLVLRRLLETRAEAAGKIEQILVFAGPWAGNVSAIRSLVRGVQVGFWPARLTAAEVRRVIRHTQAAYDLFPPDPAKTDLTDPNGRPLGLFVLDQPGRPQAGPLVDLRWVPSGAGNDFMRRLAADADARLGRRTSDIRLPGGGPPPPITNMVGWGAGTDTTCVMSGDGDVAFESTKEGDGTAVAVSAAWLRGPSVRTMFVPVGIYPTSGIPTLHARIWDAPPVLQILDETLLDRPRGPFIDAAADSDEMIDRSKDVTLRITAADPDGRALPDAQAVLRGIAAKPLSFQQRARMDAVVPRAAIRPNVQGIFRFVAEISWGPAGDRRRREVIVILKA